MLSCCWLCPVTHWTGPGVLFLMYAVFFQNEKGIYLELKIYGLWFIYFYPLSHTLLGFNLSLNLILDSWIVMLLVLGFLCPVHAY